LFLFVSVFFDLFCSVFVCFCFVVVVVVVVSMSVSALAASNPPPASLSPSPMNQDIVPLMDYWESVRVSYTAFEANQKSGSSDVYLHEMPGGQ
jgi:hypothetical protein